MSTFAVRMKRKYIHTSIRFTEFEPETPILIGSIVTPNTTIQAVGQEIGDEYDFSQEEFNHEWEMESE